MMICTPIKLVKFEKEDAKFIRETFPTYFRDNSIENIEKTIQLWKDSLCFCITYKDERVGIITLSEKANRELSWGIMIKEDYRRKGIALEAFKIARDIAREKGYSTIISSCAADNLASQKLHEKAGFQLKGKEINQAGRQMYRWRLHI